MLRKARDHMILWLPKREPKGTVLLNYNAAPGLRLRLISGRFAAHIPA